MTHTTCENCLSDLEDYTWVYCDDCWQALCTEANQLIVKNRELKKARVTVTMESFQAAIDRLLYWSHGHDGLTEGMAKLMINTMLRENGIEVGEAHVNSKVDEAREMAEEKLT